MASTDAVLQKGLLFGKLPGMREWQNYYLELTPTHLHIYDGGQRKHLRSLEIDQGDSSGEESKYKKEFRFFILRKDGKYSFKCDSNGKRTQWIAQTQRVIHQYFEDIDGCESPHSETFSPDSPLSQTSTPKHEKYRIPIQGQNKPMRAKSFGKNRSVLDTPLPPAPGHSSISPRASVISTDSGLGTSEGVEVPRQRLKQHGIRSAPVSGDGSFLRSAISSSKSDGGKFDRMRIQVTDEGTEMAYKSCKWYWDTTSRQDAERRLLGEGKVGNFIVRINASGHYVMTYWRKDGIHHHKILNHGTIFRFEKTTVDAEGESLTDLLDTYMRLHNSKDKQIEPFGGALYEQYNYAWAPPEIDMTVLEQRLKDQKRLRQEAAKASERPRQYTPVDIPLATKEDSGSGSFTSDSSTRDSPVAPRKTKQQPPTPPAKKRPAEESKKTIAATTEAESVSQQRQPGKVKPLLPPVSAKPKRSTDHSENSTQETSKGSDKPKQPGVVDFLQELKKKTDQTSLTPKTAKPTNTKRPKSSTKPSVPNGHQATSPDPQFEQPEYANMNFDVKPSATAAQGKAAGRDVPSATKPPEDDSIYMNLQPAPLPTRRKAADKKAITPQSEYQNIGTGLKKKH